MRWGLTDSLISSVPWLVLGLLLEFSWTFLELFLGTVLPTPICDTTGRLLFFPFFFYHSVSGGVSELGGFGVSLTFYCRLSRHLI